MQAGALYGKTRSLDISGGGLRIEADDPLPLNATVHVRIHLPGRTKPIRARARVKRLEEMGSGSSEKRYLSLGFEEIEPEDQEELVRFVFQQSQEMRGTE